MIRHRTAGSIISDWIIYLTLIFVSVVTLFPIVHIAAKSFSDKFNVTMGKVLIFPKGWNLDSYAAIASNPAIWKSYLYTILYSVSGTAVALLFTAMLAYPLAVKTYKLSTFTLILLAVTIFFGGGLIPTYILIRELHMIDTIWAIILPGAVSAWNVFIYRTFFKSIPESLRESAIIDGANDFIVFWRIIMPLSKALLATMTLFSMVGIWNDFFTPLIFLTDSEKYPLQMVLRRILNEFLSDDKNFKSFMLRKELNPENIQAAAIIFTSLPIMCIYPFLQKYFAKGVMIGSVKG